MGEPKEPKAAKSDSTPASTLDCSVAIGRTIGHYRLLQVLGEGGFGIVYLAEQQRPIRRRVAFKILKPGMDSRQVVTRFEAEQQALGLLDHPNIAHALNAGTTDDGRPYFVMEYVQGVPITEYCDQHRLTVNERLRPFFDVCEAVHYAHQKGIIHRDLKPSNILVATEGDRGIPKVIDFGVAKAVNQPLTEHTLYTEQGQFIGTPEYMSPEQAGLTNEGMDTRSDIYSLGVLLYEVLAGALPFESETLREKGFAGICQVIRGVDPKTPSARLSQLGEVAQEIARRRGTDMRTLARLLKRELEWIPLKAMRKEPNRRYRSASEMADDIRNYLEGRPLIAGPETVVYRVQKYVRRHVGAVAAAALVAIAVLLGFIISTTMYISAEKARTREVEASAKAEAARVNAESALKSAEEARNAETQLRVEAQRHLAGLYDEKTHQALAEGKLSEALVCLSAAYQADDTLASRKYMLAHMARRFNTTSILGSPGEIDIARFSRDGRYVFMHTRSDKLVVADATTGTQVFETKAQQFGVGPDPRLFWFFWQDNLRVCSIGTWQETLSAPCSHGPDFDASGGKVVLVDKDGCQIYETHSGRLQRTIAPPGTINSVQFSADGSQLYFGMNRVEGRVAVIVGTREYREIKGGELVIWDIERDRLAFRLRPPERNVIAEYAVPSHPYVVGVVQPSIASDEYASHRLYDLLVWDTRTGEVLAEMKEVNRDRPATSSASAGYVADANAVVSSDTVADGNQADDGRSRGLDISAMSDPNREEAWPSEYFDDEARVSAGPPDVEFTTDGSLMILDQYSNRSLRILSIPECRLIHSTGIGFHPYVVLSPAGHSMAISDMLCSRIDVYGTQGVRLGELLCAIHLPEVNPRTALQSTTGQVSASVELNEVGDRLSVTRFRNDTTELRVYAIGQGDPNVPPDVRYSMRLHEHVRTWSDSAITTILYQDQYGLTGILHPSSTRPKDGDDIPLSWFGPAYYACEFSRGDPGRLRIFNAAHVDALSQLQTEFRKAWLSSLKAKSQEIDGLIWDTADSNVPSENTEDHVVCAIPTRDGTAVVLVKGAIERFFWLRDGQEIVLELRDLATGRLRGSRRFALADIITASGPGNPIPMDRAAALREITMRLAPSGRCLAGAVYHVKRLDVAAFDILNVTNGGRVATCRLPTDGPLATGISLPEDSGCDVQFTPDGSKIFGNMARSWLIWDATTGRCLFEGSGSILGVSADATRAIQVDRVLDLQTGKTIAKIEGSLAGGTCLGFAQGDSLIVGFGEEGSAMHQTGNLAVWCARTGRLLEEIPIPSPALNPPYYRADQPAIAFSDLRTGRLNTLRFSRTDAESANAHGGARLALWEWDIGLKDRPASEMEAWVRRCTNLRLEDMGLSPDGTPASSTNASPSPKDQTQRDLMASPPRLTEDGDKKVVAWAFDETQPIDDLESRSFDQSPQGILVGDAHLVDDSERGKVLSLDGSGDYVYCGSQWQVGTGSQITVASWVKTRKLSKSYQALVTKGDTSWRLQGNGIGPGLCLHCTGVTSSGKWGGVEATADVNDGAWHHAVGVYGGSRVCLYIDGRLEKAETAAGTIGANQSPVLIGGWEPGGGWMHSDTGAWDSYQRVDREWNGLIDDVRIYNYALSAAEVKALYEETRRPK
ncbi:MAG: protein kinase [Sedimentisphaerales bacterium]|nr:protein kinase [Sedimentisphaerales bacterium]